MREHTPSCVSITVPVPDLSLVPCCTRTLQVKAKIGLNEKGVR